MPEYLIQDGDFVMFTTLSGAQSFGYVRGDPTPLQVMVDDGYGVWPCRPESVYPLDAHNGPHHEGRGRSDPWEG